MVFDHALPVAVPHRADSLARTLLRLHGECARAVHTRLGRVGHLWQARYHSVPMDEEHFWATLVYVEQNPLLAGLSDDCAGWRWSSARPHLAGADSGLLDLVRWREHHTPESWKRCLELGLRDAALLERIREATLYGKPVGGDEFLDRIEREFQVEARQRRPGRPRRERKPSISEASVPPPAAKAAG